MCAEKEEIVFDLRHVSAEEKEPILELVKTYRQLEGRYRRLRAAVCQARIYAGDNLPADKGLTIVTMLEKALKGEAK